MDQNGVSKQMRRTIIDMIRVTILESNIDNKLWLEHVFAMTYIKNNQPTRALQNLTPMKNFSKSLPTYLIYKY